MFKGVNNLNDKIQRIKSQIIIYGLSTNNLLAYLEVAERLCDN